MEMAGQNDGTGLERTTSHVSTASRRSARAGSRKHSLVTPTSAKTLESFPSLSPDASPGTKPDRQLAVQSQPQTPSETPRKPSKKNPSTVESLIKSTPSFRGRSALFEDSPKGSPQDVPGALHMSSDADIRHLIKKNGAVVLVRQLALDVAQRDAEITLFRRQAEERERELKKMLREVEVSNLDIETRLHRIEHATDESFKLQDPPQKAGTKSPGGRDRKDRIPGVTNGIDEMMGEAMKDDVGRLSAEIDEGYLDSLAETDKQATVKARSVLSKESDGRSITSSVDSQGRPSSTLRGWKDYLWNGNATSHKTSRASSVVSDYNEEVGSVMRARGYSGSNGRRKGLDQDLFSPPSYASTAEHSRRSSNSVASWTMKLFAGNVQASRDPDKQGTVRGRSSTTGSAKAKPPGTNSTTSGPAPTTAKAALMKVNSMDTSSHGSKKPAQPLPLKVGGTLRGHPQPSNVQMPASPGSADAATNLGPVEMDTIHPADSKPPTLTQFNKKNDGLSDLLTDRFGFIYDQRRRKKAAEMSKGHARGKSNVSANVELIGGARDSLKITDPDRVSIRSKANSVGRPETPGSNDDRAEDKPTKRWQDYLKVATFPTELLSHTPSAKPATTVISSDAPSPRLKRAPTTGGSRVSLPSTSLNPEPEMSPVTAENAEIVQSSLSPESAQATSTTVEEEPVKLLLAQLTELHDTLQREKTIKWNEFLRKVRAERKREGESAVSSDARSKLVMPEVALTDGEMIGVAGLGNKGKVGQAKWKEFKQLVLGGIPVAYRAKIWAECSGASALKVPGYYDELVASNIDDPTIVAQIQMDINRTLTDNIFFRKGPGVTKLNEVLLAYSRRNPEVGYCQGMNLITASLLLIMPTAEDAFWVLTSMIENILPQHYYDHSLLASRADQQVLRQYVTEILPKLSAHLDELGIELEALTFQWFLSVFTDCLSAEALFRVWDVVLCFNDGSTFLFQVALALLKLNEAQLLECDSAALVYGYIGNEMTDHAISIDGLVSASDALKREVRRSEVEERRWKAVEEERGREKGRKRGASDGSGASGELSLREPRPVEDEVEGVKG
ncbi:hypothetical protein OEA41_005693 [Lepraria neglecta]|uniref:Rab-GAP TBC domain-containing protein n=1 Tax=Lepraria neglecta TaxID=209136 RepID=A0AAD9Z9U4_9LECA|nr:hypothetical protein OEA41_005693 [Lepraria neglecta]